MLLQADTRRAGGFIVQLATVAAVGVLLAGAIAPSSDYPTRSTHESDSRPLILDGQSTGANEFPFLVSISEGKKRGSEHRCTGSIIGGRHIVTSAKCIEQTANELTAKLGCTSKAGCKREVDIARVLVHPFYHVSRLKHRDQYDLALLLTDDQIEFDRSGGIMPVGMSSEHMNPLCKRRFTLAGFGKNESSGMGAMLKFQAAIVHTKECAGNQTFGKATLCVHTTTGFLPRQFTGSALVARPVRPNEGHCRGQDIQLLGLVSTIGRNLTSTVTDLIVTQKDLLKIAAGSFRPSIGPAPPRSPYDRPRTGKGSPKPPGGTGENLSIDRMINMAEKWRESLERLTDG